MSYQVIARKWRPQSFTELVGQDHIGRTLLNALRSQRLPHALLFTGARGVGKTSTARILAKSLRCLNAVDFVPCNTCRSCEEINHSSSVDVMEIDAAANNGVDAIRELRETVGYMPSYGKYKVYIIDEVHMLSTSAFNALLKTLEEPPEQVIFILATTEPQKIPMTVLSRCQRFDFRRIPTRQIMEQMQKICTNEKITAESEALWLIARQADGSMRDSQSLLDQISTFSQGTINLEKVISILGLTDRTLLRQTMEALIARDSSQIMDVIEKIFVAGADPKLFAYDILEELRHALLLKNLKGESAQPLIDLPDSEIEFLKTLTEPFSEEDLHLLFDMALKGASDLSKAPDPRIVLEVLLLRMVHAPRIADLSALFANTVTPTTSRTVSAPKISSPVTPSEKPSQQPIKAEKFNSAFSKEQNWLKLVQQIKARNSLLGAKLDVTTLTALSETTLTLGYPKQQEFLAKQLGEMESKTEIQNLVKEIWGLQLNVEVHPMEKSKTTSVVTPKALQEKQTQSEQDQLQKEIEQDPLVKATQEIFKAKITSITNLKE